jgi:hypothetical protein
MTEDFYDLMDVDEDASQDEIKAAFREKVREYHPDLNDDHRAQAQFTALKKAYDTLGNSSERNSYDRMGHEDYVAKRIKGLPSQDVWSDSSSSSSSSSSSTTSGRSSRTTTDARGSASRSSSSRTAGSTSSTGTASSSTDGGTGTTASGSSTASSNSGTATASYGGTTTSDATTTEDRGPLARLLRIQIGWPGIAVADAIYLIGATLFALATLGSLRSFGTALATTDVATIRGAATQAPTTGFADYLYGTDYVAATAVSVRAAILVAGAVALPLVYAVVVKRTRRASIRWDPTWLYVVCTLAPAVGVGLNLAGYAYVGADVALFFLLPLLPMVALPASAFVRPFVKRVFFSY